MFKVPRGLKNGSGIYLGLPTPSLVQLTNNNAKNSTGIHSHHSFYEETEAQRSQLSNLLEVTPRSLVLELGNVWFTILSLGCMMCIRTKS